MHSSLFSSLGWRQSAEDLSPCQSLVHSMDVCAMAPPHIQPAFAVTPCPLQSWCCSPQDRCGLQGPKLRCCILYLYLAAAGLLMMVGMHNAGPRVPHWHPKIVIDIVSCSLGPDFVSVLDKCSENCQIWVLVTWPRQVPERKVRLGISYVISTGIYFVGDEGVFGCASRSSHANPKGVPFASWWQKQQ